MIRYTVSLTEQHFSQILKLQQANLPKNVDEEEKKKEGFVTLEHDLELLKKLNTPFAHVIAMDGDKVVGYTLITVKEHVAFIPLLQPTLEELKGVTFDNINLHQSKFFIMGQVCIDKLYRGQNIFRGLYDSLSNRMSTDFDFIITEIATHNYRSMCAHKKIGFQVIKQHKDDLGEWAMVVLDIRKR